jgi:flavin-dependent dehydrogenase
MDLDVAIIGGGPSGSTTGAILKKYNPDLKVAIFERETFPRDHIGESQLPGISPILEEMGVWDKVEAANFPIKLGGTYRWGKTAELWDVEFYPAEKFTNESRPAKFVGQRRQTAFQVDRAVYDKILLDHAEELGCDVYQATKVTSIQRDGDLVSSLTVNNGEVVYARHYVDASGHSGILRRAMGIQTECPTNLQNIAIWDYFQNADWAVEIGVGGTRIQVLSVGYGWIWFIPLSPTRTSVGLVVPAKFYKQSGKKPAELFEIALSEDERIAGLMANATSEGKLQTTKDWSFVSSRHAGLNWLLVGESGGFADPILSAGMTIAHAAGREAAYLILEMDRGERDAVWLRSEYEIRQKQRVTNHMRFADYWYGANAQMKDLKEHTAEIAKAAGIELSPDRAWAWLAQGGFINEDLTVGTGAYSLNGVKALSEFLSDFEPSQPFDKFNVFELNLAGATWRDRASFALGRVKKSQAYVRGERVLPVEGVFQLVVDILQKESTVQGFVKRLAEAVEPLRTDPGQRSGVILNAIQALEAMINDGWVTASHDPSKELINLKGDYFAMRWNKEAARAK